MCIRDRGAVRQVGKDMHMEDGTTIPKGAVCMLNQFVCNRNPEVFPNPEEFRPERWETIAMKDPLSFAAGPRNCPGQYLATAQINSLLPRILAEFNLEIADEGTLEFLGTLKFNSKVRAKKL